MDAAGIREAPMSSILAYGTMRPVIDGSVFVAEGARIIGDVHIGRDSSIWFNAVVRGDVNAVRIGERTNVQDNCVLHVTHEKHALTIGSDVTIGHGVVLHGATVRDACLIGMGAVVLDGSVIGSNSFVAAGSVVLEGFEVPEGVLVAGTPGRVKRDLAQHEIEMIRQSARNYVTYVQSYRRS
jgi:carbonic anhydrase/acetyltransferase-like protein (isoleucine patch superfamily)